MMFVKILLAVYKLVGVVIRAKMGSVSSVNCVQSALYDTPNVLMIIIA